MKQMRRSIRWELPLNYAAIALLAALALGGVLLLVLRSYYLRLERDYLLSNAQVLGLSLAQPLEEDRPMEELQARLDSISFLSGTRVRLLDRAGQVLASSNLTKDYRVAFLPGDERAAAGEEPDVPWPAGRLLIVRPGVLASTTFTTTGDIPWLPREGSQRVPASSPEARTPWVPGPLARLDGPLARLAPEGGVALFSIQEHSSATSGQVVTMPIYDSANHVLGFVELSQGPAYAQQIVGAVAWGWGIAGVVAVALAAVAGWLVSRRITAPLLALTDVTASMADGALSVRARAGGSDELGTLARSFNVMADQVEETVVTLRRFVSDAAHELHTPLTTLRANLDMMRPRGGAESGGDSPTEQAERLARAQAQVERLEVLTRGMLDLSRLEAGTGQGADERFSLTALAQEINELYTSQAEQTGLDFELSLPETPVTVHGNKTHLRQAVANLLDNALKFTPEGGSVELGLNLEDGAAVVWVADTGIGLLEEDLPQLFERFHRGRNSAEYPGSGLGLAIVRAIADEHGGQVKAERTEQGSRFSFRMPCD